MAITYEKSRQISNKRRPLDTDKLRMRPPETQHQRPPEVRLHQPRQTLQPVLARGGVVGQTHPEGGQDGALRDTRSQSHRCPHHLHRVSYTVG